MINSFVIAGKKKGFINTSGKVVIPIEYDKAESFREGFAVVKGKS